MKKLVIAIALCLGMVTFTFAHSDSLNSTEYKSGITQTSQDEYKVVQVTDLNQAVQTAIEAYDSYNVKKVELNELTKQTRVTLEEKESKAEKVVILDEAGKEVQ